MTGICARAPSSARALKIFVAPASGAYQVAATAIQQAIEKSRPGDLVEIDRRSRAVKVLAGQFNGKRFNGANDLVVDVRGFTVADWNARRDLAYAIVEAGRSELPLPGATEVAEDDAIELVSQ